MNLKRLLKRLPLWALMPIWCFAAASITLGVFLFAQGQQAPSSLPQSANEAMVAWIWAEIALFAACIVGAVCFRFRLNGQLRSLSSRAAQVGTLAPESFKTGISRELHPLADALSGAAEQVQAHMLASRQNEQYARHFLDSNFLGIAFWRKDGTLFNANDALLRLIGYSREDLQNNQLFWSKLTPEEYRPLDARALEEITRTGQCHPYEKEYLHRDGHRVPVLVAGARTDELGEEGVCFVIDRTAARRDHALLTRRIELDCLITDFSTRLISTPCEQLPAAIDQALSEYGLRSGIKGASVFLFLVDFHGQRLHRAHDWRSPAYVAIGSTTRLSPDILREIDRLRAGETVQTYSGRNGSEPPRCLEAAVPLICGGALSGVLRIELAESEQNLSTGDLTLFHLLGQMITNAIARLRADAALRESEETKRAVWESALDGIITMDADGSIQDWNPAAEKIFGFTREEAVGSTLADRIIPEQLQKLHEDGMRQFLASGKPTLVGEQLEIQALRKDGTQFPCELSIMTVGRAEGGPLFISTVRDVTERNRLEEQLRQAERMESVGQLAAGVAHDFNNILTIQQSYVSELAELEGLPEKAREAITEIIAASERAAGLTRKLLAFGRKQAMQPRSLDCNEFLRSISGSISRVLGDEISCSFNTAPKLPNVIFDVSMLEQVILGLVSNAHDAMPDGGTVVISTASVEIGDEHLQSNPEARAGSFVQVTVTDTGCGISPDNLQRIFEPFFTTKDASRGSGLGLATAHGILKQNNGWIEVDSQLFAGTSFRIYLPAIQAPVPAAASTVPKASQGASSTKETILVVEDEVQLCTVVGRFLKRHGYNVLTAASGVDALKIWEEQGSQIDLLLTDLVMPEGMTGTELADRLLAQRPDLRVLYTSGYSPEVAGCDLTLRDGFNFLPKPYQPSALAKVVRECLDKV